jgi:predicted aminopeptidase
MNSQGSFNESLASFFAGKVTPLYIERRIGKASLELKTYLQNESENQEYVRFLQEAYVRLDTLYKSSLNPEKVSEEKTKEMKKIQDRLKLKVLPNNGYLIQFKTYDSHQDIFQKIWDHCGQNPTRFILNLKTLKPKDFKSEQLDNFSPILETILNQPCH